MLQKVDLVWGDLIPLRILQLDEEEDTMEVLGTLMRVEVEGRPSCQDIRGQ
jgi:hypothetical protein